MKREPQTDRELRRRIMQAVKRSRTKPELLLASALHKRGFRFRRDVKTLPGRPDFSFPKWRAVIFVHGCFWHRHGCRRTTTPKSNEEFWSAKFVNNIERDLRAINSLRASGWRTGIVWECGLSRAGVEVRDLTIDVVSDWLVSNENELNYPKNA